MLEFIVLGQIPGTNIHITLAWFALTVLGLLVWADIKLHTQTLAKTPAKKSPVKNRRSNRARA